LLPVAFHPKVGELCVKHGKHLVTASYISPQMKQLDEAYVILIMPNLAIGD
jgi:alpha-aminoadipic semialdehyde synthase